MSSNKTFTIVVCAILTFIGWILYLKHIEYMSPPNRGHIKELGDIMSARTDTLISIGNSQIHIQKRILELRQKQIKLERRIDSLERTAAIKGIK